MWHSILFTLTFLSILVSGRHLPEIKANNEAGLEGMQSWNLQQMNDEILQSIFGPLELVVPVKGLQRVKRDANSEDEAAKSLLVDHLLEHKFLYGKCMALWDVSGKFAEEMREAAKSGYIPTLWLMAKSWVIGKFEDLRKIENEAKRLCIRAGASFNGAMKYRNEHKINSFDKQFDRAKEQMMKDQQRIQGRGRSMEEAMNKLKNG